jgi:hypothetical protein
MLANVLGALEAAPTCACGGRPSIWEGICSVNEVRGNKAYIDTVYITTYVSSVQLETGREALKAGDEVEVLAFLPAKEEAPQS